MESAYAALHQIPEEATKSARGTDTVGGGHGHDPALQSGQETLQQTFTGIRNAVGEKEDYKEE